MSRRLSFPPRAGAGRGSAWRNAALAAALAVVSLTPQAAGSGVQLAEVTPRGADAWSAVLIVGQCLPLAVRRRWPAVSLAVVACSFAVYQALGYRPSLAGVSLFVALYSAGAYAGRFRRGLAAGATAGYAGLAAVLRGLHSRERPVDYLTFYVALAACWAGGAWVRRWQAGESERRRAAERAAIANERVRIARELHDVVTHHVTAIVVQSDAAQHTAPDRTARTLATISGTGRQALNELRLLLDVLDAPADTAGASPTAGGSPEEVRTPVLGRLRDLVERARQAGQPVELVEDGEPPASLPPGPELAAYRVVQETLTNAVKHAPGRRTVVRVGYGEDIHIDVTTGESAAPAGAPVPDGVAVSAGVGTSTGAGGAETPAAPAATDPPDLLDPPVPAHTDGRGLTGLRERVHACGGELIASRLLGGGFRVHARIPTGGPS